MRLFLHLLVLLRLAGLLMIPVLPIRLVLHQLGPPHYQLLSAAPLPMQQVQEQQHLMAALPGVQQVVSLLPLAPAPAPAAAAAAAELLAAAAYPPLHRLQSHCCCCCCCLPHPAVLLLVLLLLLELLLLLGLRWGLQVAGMPPQQSG